MDNNEVYRKGFNAGYQLAKFEPELLEKLLKSNQSGNHEYFEGMKNGRMQHEKEIIQEKLINREQNREL